MILITKRNREHPVRLQSRIVTIAIATLLFTVYVHTETLAVGVGLFSHYGGGAVTYTYKHESTGNTLTNEYSGERWYIGLVVDTAVARDELLNYRFHLGFGLAWRNFSWGTMSMREYSMYHTFGFGLYRSETVRLWLGPEFGYGIGIDRDNSKNLEAFGTIGFMAGANVHIGSLITLFIEGGARYGFYAGNADTISNMYGSGYEYVGGAGILFRFGDLYRYVEEL